MVRISSSTVHSSRSASVASATSSVDARADHVDAEHLVVFLLGDDLHEAVGLAGHPGAAEDAERERARRGRRSPARWACLLGQADAADLGIAVGAAGHVVVVDRPDVLAGDALGERAMPSADDTCASCGCPGSPKRDDVADRGDARHAGAEQRVDLDVAAFDLQAEPPPRRGPSVTGPRPVATSR